MGIIIEKLAEIYMKCNEFSVCVNENAGNDPILAQSDTENQKIECVLRHREELENLLKKLNLKKEEICLVGGAGLVAQGIRENNDIDFVARSGIKNDIIKRLNLKEKNNTYQITENVDLKSDWASCIGITDDELINNSKYHIILYGFKVSKVEIVLSVKNCTLRAHDIKHIKMIGEHIVKYGNCDWDLVMDGKELSHSNLFIKFFHESIANLINKIKNVYKYVVYFRCVKLITTNDLILRYPVSKLLPKQYLNGQFNRMDLAVRYMAIENYFSENQYGFKLYNKMQYHRVGNDYNSEERFKRLIESIYKNGFDCNSKITIDTNGNLLDGAHRLALSLYFKEQDISVNISTSKSTPKYGINWFKNNNFSADEIELIENKYLEICERAGIFFYMFLWPPVQKYFDEIESDIKNDFGIIWSRNIIFSKNIEEFIRSIYSTDDIDKWKIERKIHYMKKYAPNIRIICLEIIDPKFRKKSLNNHDISIVCEDIKKKYRNKYSNKIDNYIYDIIIHTSDNYEQNMKIAEILSQNEYSTSSRPL